VGGVRDVAGGVSGAEGAVAAGTSLEDEDLRRGETLMEHELKTWPVYFDRLMSKEKTFEVRKDDRGFQTGDHVVLREFDPHHCSQSSHCTDPKCEKRYTGRELRFKVGFVYRQGAGLDCGEYVVMSLLPPEAVGS
jgi:hypothetical protein